MSPQAFADKMQAPFREAWKLLGCELRRLHPHHRAAPQAARRRSCGARSRRAATSTSATTRAGTASAARPSTPRRTCSPGNVCPHAQEAGRAHQGVELLLPAERLPGHAARVLRAAPRLRAARGPLQRGEELRARRAARPVASRAPRFSWGVPVPERPQARDVRVVRRAHQLHERARRPCEPRATAPLYDRFWPPAARSCTSSARTSCASTRCTGRRSCSARASSRRRRSSRTAGSRSTARRCRSRSATSLAPEPLVEAFGVDVLRYYLMRDVAFGQDGDFTSRQPVRALSTASSANGLGNLLNRVLASIVKSSSAASCRRRRRARATPRTRRSRRSRCAARRPRREHLDAVAPQRALEAIWELVAAANRYVDRSEPWALAKRGDTARLAQVVYQVLEAVRIVGVMIAPVHAGKAAALREQLGLAPLAARGRSRQLARSLGRPAAGTQTRPGGRALPAHRQGPRARAARAALRRSPRTPEGKPRRRETSEPAAQPSRRSAEQRRPTPASPTTTSPRSSCAWRWC